MGEVLSLLSQWQERLNNKSYSPEYLDALRDCIYDLDNALQKEFTDELSARNLLQEIEADDWLSTMEAHEAA